MDVDDDLASTISSIFVISTKIEDVERSNSGLRAHTVVGRSPKGGGRIERREGRSPESKEIGGNELRGKGVAHELRIS